MAESNGKSVLIVDDDKEVLELTIRLLRREGYDVSVAHSKLEAESLYLRQSPKKDPKKFDVILVDSLESSTSPNFSGLDLADEFRQAGCSNVYFYSNNPQGHPQQVEAKNRNIPSMEKTIVREFLGQLAAAAGLTK